MNVLHVVPAIAPRYGGPSVAAINMCAALEERGVRVLLATSDADGSGRLSVPCGQEIRHGRIHAIFFSRTATEGFKWTPGLTRWLRSHAARFDVVHVHAVFSHASLAAGRAARKAGRPYLVRPLGSLDPWSLRRHSVRKRALLEMGGRRLLQDAAAIHYTSDEERALAEQSLAGLPPAAVIPLGVDDGLFDEPAAGRAAHEPYVLALSRLDSKKGLDVLIAAFHRLPADAHGWRLVIAGDGEPSYVAELRRAANAGPARARIEFRGWVEEPERTRWFRSAALYALPSSQENFGISVVEAMACGVPVVVTPGINIARDLEHAGAGWVVERTPEAVAFALRTAIADSSERERRGRQARAFAARYRWAAVAGDLCSLYERITAARKTRDPLTAVCVR